MSRSAVERRIAPRFSMDYRAELAWGHALAPVQIWDVSMTGCGLRILDPTVLAQHPLQTKGLLVFGLRGDAYSTMLPVVLIHDRLEAELLCQGWLFRVLSHRQKRSLIRLIEENTLQMRWRRAS